MTKIKIQTQSSYTAVAAVEMLVNCSVDLLVQDNGAIDDMGRLGSELRVIDSNIRANIQRAKASAIRRFSKGGERLEGWSRLFLTQQPSQTAEYVRVNGDLYKVFDDDIRPTELYFELIIARQI